MESLKCCCMYKPRCTWRQINFLLQCGQGNTLFGTILVYKTWWRGIGFYPSWGMSDLRIRFPWRCSQRILGFCWNMTFWFLVCPIPPEWWLGWVTMLSFGPFLLGGTIKFVFRTWFLCILSRRILGIWWIMVLCFLVYLIPLGSTNTPDDSPVEDLILIGWFGDLVWKMCGCPTND